MIGKLTGSLEKIAQALHKFSSESKRKADEAALKAQSLAFTGTEESPETFVHSMNYPSLIAEFPRFPSEVYLNNTV